MTRLSPVTHSELVSDSNTTVVVNASLTFYGSSLNESMLKTFLLLSVHIWEMHQQKRRTLKTLSSNSPLSSNPRIGSLHWSSLENPLVSALNDVTFLANHIAQIGVSQNLDLIVFENSRCGK